MRRLIFAAIISLACSNTNQTNADPGCRIDLQAALSLSFVSNLAAVETKINGVPALLGFDTGATTLLTPEAVKAMGLTRDGRRTRAVGTTAVLLANNYIVGDLEFAGRHYRHKSVPALALRQDRSASGSIKGLIGTDILADFDLDFDFPNRKLNVYTVTGCKTVTPPGFTAVTSMRFSFNRQRGAVLAAELDGKKLTAVIDTGATGFAITRAAATRLKVTAATVNTDLSIDATGVGNVTVKQLQHQFRSLSFGSETIRDPLISIINTPVTAGDVLLGQRFLFSRRFFISNATRTLFLGQAPAPAFTYTPSSALRASPEKHGGGCKYGPPRADSADCVSAASAGMLLRGAAGAPSTLLPSSPRTAGMLLLGASGTPSIILPPSPEMNGESCKDGPLHGDAAACLNAADAKLEEKTPAPAFTYKPSTVFRLPPKKNGDGCQEGAARPDSPDCVSAAGAKPENKN